MAKEAQMTLRIEPELRAAFSDAAALEDRPAAQVLRELMRAYIAQVSERDHRTASDVISAAEHRRRENAVNFARSSVGLEGFKPSEAAESDARLFINGDISLADFVQVKPDAARVHRY